MKRTSFAASLLLVGICYSSASAVPLAVEAFDYPNDSNTIDGRSGGFGWSGPWSDADGDFNRLTMDDTSLSLSSYPFPVSGDRVTGTGASEAIRGFNGQIDLSQDGQVIYASALFQQDADGGTSGDNVELDLGFDGGNTIRVGGGSDEAFFLGSSAVTSAGAGRFMQLGQAYMLILKVTSNAATNDLLQASFYGPSDTVPMTEPVTWDLENNLINSSVILNSIRLVTGANTMGASFDEIRIGFAYADVAVFDPTFVQGDFDGLNGIDPNDYVTLRNNMFTGTTYAQGDFDGNGLVDLKDFIGFREVWNAQGLGAFPGAVVPEPATVALLAIGALLCGGYYRRRGQR